MERSPFVDKFESDLGFVEIQKKNGTNSVVMKAFGFVVFVCLLALAYTSGRHAGSWNGMSAVTNMEDNKIVVKDTIVQKVQAKKPNTYQPGAYALANVINKGRNSGLIFRSYFTKDANGNLNPLMVAAAARNAAWIKAGLSVSTTPPFTNSPVSSTDTQAAITSSFTSITAPTLYKEYNYYGDYSSKSLANLLLGNPDFKSSLYTNIAVVVSPDTLVKGNAYWTIILSSSYPWVAKL